MIRSPRYIKLVAQYIHKWALFHLQRNFRQISGFCDQLYRQHFPGFCAAKWAAEAMVKTSLCLSSVKESPNQHCSQRWCAVSVWARALPLRAVPRTLIDWRAAVVSWPGRVPSLGAADYREAVVWAPYPNLLLVLGQLLSQLAVACMTLTAPRRLPRGRRKYRCLPAKPMAWQCSLR